MISTPSSHIRWRTPLFFHFLGELRRAIEWVNECVLKGGFIKIPWTDEQRIFPIPISAIGGDVIYLESYGKKNPKLPDFLSSIPFKRKA